MAVNEHPRVTTLEDYEAGRLTNQHAIDFVKAHLPCAKCASDLAEAKRHANEPAKEKKPAKTSVKEASPVTTEKKPGLLRRLFGG